MEREYVLASGNAGKLREIVSTLKPLGFNVRPQSDWRVPEAAETACTFVENSLIKAEKFRVVNKGIFVFMIIYNEQPSFSCTSCHSRESGNPSSVKQYF